MIWGSELAAIDFETTGLSPADGDRAIEVAVVRGRHGTSPRLWSTLLSPGRPVDATEIHGITEEMLAGQPSFAAVAAALREQVEGAVLVAHNARFDLSFLEMEYRRAGTPAPAAPVLDTLGLSRRLLPLPSHSLGAVAAHLGIDRGRAHRALDDARTTWDVAWALLERADPARALGVEDVLRLSRRPSTVELREVTDALLEAARRAEPIEIEYRRLDAPPTRRAITVRRVAGARVEAFCHLRGEERVFRIDRIVLVTTSSAA